MENINGLVADLSAIADVEAIALGGSRATGSSDEKSDYDLYVYLASPVPEDARKTILSRYCSYMEIGNSYWELEDDCVLNSGIVIELIYRNLDDFARGVSAVVQDHAARNGYTTCMWHNLLTCKVLFDRSGRLGALKDRFSVPYPAELRRNVVAKNLELLSGRIPSFDAQILKAAGRGDAVSVNHRLTEFLASYFDLVFAFNGVPHPGEKRMVENCVKYCSKLPLDFEANIDRLLRATCDPLDLSESVAAIVRNVKELVTAYSAPPQPNAAQGCD